MKLLITCPFGTNKILNQELKFLGFSTFDHFSTGVYTESDRWGIIRCNLWSRIANKVFIETARKGAITDFDKLFDLIHAVSREDYLYLWSDISIKTFSTNSTLNSLTTIQSISHKAILKRLEEKWDVVMKKAQTIFEIQIHINNNECSVFLNTSGNGLHERGYRKDTGEAPLKENLAAALLFLAGRSRKSNLIDPCCGSGTIVIEAAMIAKNIAPWLLRSFAFQEFSHYDPQLFSDYHTSAKDAIYPSSDYRIIWTDLDQSIITKAKANAEVAGVADCIQFRWKDIRELEKESFERKTYIISNPPYGKRLAPLDIHEVYQCFIELSKKKHSEISIISSYEDFDNLTQKRWSRKEMRNGGELCYIRTS